MMVKHPIQCGRQNTKKKAIRIMNWDLVIFDCDGILVDSEPISNGTLVEMLSEIGLSISLASPSGEHIRGS